MATQRRQEISQVAVAGAGVQTVNIGTNAAVGAAIGYCIMLQGIRTDAAAQMGLYFSCEGLAARNATANGFANVAAVGPTGFTDPAAAPWTAAPAVPAGWAAAVAFAGNILQLQYNGAAGQTVIWSGYVLSFYMNGATV